MSILTRHLPLATYAQSLDINSPRRLRETTSNVNTGTTFSS
jgi:hypothetical protein